MDLSNLTPEIVKANSLTLAGLASARHSGCAAITVRIIAHRAGTTPKLVRKQLATLCRVAPSIHSVVEDFYPEEVAEQLELRGESIRQAIAHKTETLSQDKWMARLQKKYGVSKVDSEMKAWMEYTKRSGKPQTRSYFEWWINKQAKDITVTPERRTITQRTNPEVKIITHPAPATYILEMQGKGLAEAVPQTRWPEHLKGMSGIDLEMESEREQLPV